MSKKKANPGPSYVPQALCDERSSRIFDAIKGVEKKLDGYIAKVESKQEQSSHFWRNFSAGIISGVALMFAGYFFSLLPGV